MIAIIDYDAGNVKVSEGAGIFARGYDTDARPETAACSRKSHPSGCWGIRGMRWEIKRIWSD